ncbi:MAG: rhodanese-like domain-containing protein [Gammaproteobacteria bacterium]
MLKDNLVSRFFVIAIILLLTACNSDPEETLNSGITVQTANEMITKNKNVVILDVRTPKEFARGHISGAVNISIHDPAFPQKASKLDNDKTYIVHCAVNPRGGRGDKSIDIMTKLGFSNLLSMDGGINAWKRAGLPLN